MDDALALLRREFDAEEGTFLFQLRGDGIQWDRVAFTRLERAMRTVCERLHDEEKLDRWLAEGFYYASRFVRDWTSHPSFPRPEPPQFHEDCLARLEDLADWFFRGWHVYQEPHVWPDL
ncbi:hypothetical protein I6A84_26235 [Frankia sp. CNm7]|uniref:Uncharacterized protein n=1 Tax=Frankia nepalensis TaxID=1836974 RepID=A0A937UV06_9ACTN|nr:hypothetical protein [Frankia nepalensis]MBL7501012.1 hypothetical protein [Frankia nepalensis]MBL7512487.1 hypothetical protein [Frankia nepalensis]MBL7521486.1 hypothetical protein [Frankia nepalensis]MBL7632790.1 hypothetical protein [Frankia nepalensis]